jgi:hypothetical protein
VVHHLNLATGREPVPGTLVQAGTLVLLPVVLHCLHIITLQVPVRTLTVPVECSSIGDTTRTNHQDHSHSTFVVPVLANTTCTVAPLLTCSTVQVVQYIP